MISVNDKVAIGKNSSCLVIGQICKILRVTDIHSGSLLYTVYGISVDDDNPPHYIRTYVSRSEITKIITD
jgi:hypothetical protein